MKQNYPVYSKKLNKVFDTVAELEAAEQKALEAEQAELAKKEARADRAKEVENAYKEAEICRKHADELLNKFVEDYGSFHTSISGHKPEDLFDFLFRTLF